MPCMSSRAVPSEHAQKYPGAARHNGPGLATQAAPNRRVNKPHLSSRPALTPRGRNNQGDPPLSARSHRAGYRPPEQPGPILPPTPERERKRPSAPRLTTPRGTFRSRSCPYGPHTQEPKSSGNYLADEGGEDFISYASAESLNGQPPPSPAPASATGTSVKTRLDKLVPASSKGEEGTQRPQTEELSTDRRFSVGKFISGLYESESPELVTPRRSSPPTTGHSTPRGSRSSTTPRRGQSPSIFKLNPPIEKATGKEDFHAFSEWTPAAPPPRSALILWSEWEQDPGERTLKEAVRRTGSTPPRRHPWFGSPPPVPVIEDRRESPLSPLSDIASPISLASPSMDDSIILPQPHSNNNTPVEGNLSPPSSPMQPSPTGPSPPAPDHPEPDPSDEDDSSSYDSDSTDSGERDQAESEDVPLPMPSIPSPLLSIHIPRLALERVTNRISPPPSPDTNEGRSRSDTSPCPDPPELPRGFRPPGIPCGHVPEGHAPAPPSQRDNKPPEEGMRKRKRRVVRVRKPAEQGDKWVGPQCGIQRSAAPGIARAELRRKGGAELLRPSSARGIRPSDDFELMRPHTARERPSVHQALLARKKKAEPAEGETVRRTQKTSKEQRINRMIDSGPAPTRPLPIESLPETPRGTRKRLKASPRGTRRPEGGAKVKAVPSPPAPIPSSVRYTDAPTTSPRKPSPTPTQWYMPPSSAVTTTCSEYSRVLLYGQGCSPPVTPRRTSPPREDRPLSGDRSPRHSPPPIPKSYSHQPSPSALQHPGSALSSLPLGYTGSPPAYLSTQWMGFTHQEQPALSGTISTQHSPTAGFLLGPPLPLTLL